jgi:diketogulonate reductase-like aldo/keto reductase
MSLTSYLIHAPIFAKTPADLQRAWAEMEAVKKANKAKSIGVSNYLQTHLETTLATATIPPSINQIEYHPYLQHGNLLSYQHSSANIATAAYGPLSAVTKAKPGPVDEYMAQLAKKYYVSEGEISLRWCMDQGVVAVTTSGKASRLSDYLRATTFKLTLKEVDEIKRLGDTKHYRGFWNDKFAKDDRS